MKYKISICYPDKSKIEHRQLIDKETALSFITNYPWRNQIKLMNSLPVEKVQYSPSVRISNVKNRHYLELTYHCENREESLFSLWYGRAKEVKLFFGFLGKIKKNNVYDKWDLNKDDAIYHFEKFLEEDYINLEKLMIAS
ncbi:hypothetical protein [Tenacibaculum sp. 190524A05c]|uniref:hypothetical protein n=1 Tax=Tenacibaculum platacis TaxID=3137852 RepID=UPI0031FB1722